MTPPRRRRRRCLRALLLAAHSAAGARSGNAGAPPPPSSRPRLSITVRDGNLTDGVQGFDPVVSWEHATLLAHDVKLEYGIDLSARTTNLANLPKRIWGRASRVFAERFALSARLETDVQAPDRVDFEIDGEVEGSDLTLRALGSMSTAGLRSPGSRGARGRLTFLECTKGFDNDGNRVTINPRYRAAAGRADVVATYDAGDTLLTVVASPDDQAVTISQKLNAENVISPTIRDDGSLSLAWDRQLGEGNAVRTTLHPNRSVDVEWRDAAWTVDVNFPMEENDLSGATVHIKRDIKF